MSWQQGCDISNFTTLDQYTADFIMDFKTTGSLSKWSEKKALQSAQTAGYTMLATHWLKRQYLTVRYYVVGLDTMETKVFEVRASAFMWQEVRDQAIDLAKTLSEFKAPDIRNERRCEEWCKFWASGGCGVIKKKGSK